MAGEYFCKPDIIRLIRVLRAVLEEGARHGRTYTIKLFLNVYSDDDLYSRIKAFYHGFLFCNYLPQMT